MNNGTQQHKATPPPKRMALSAVTRGKLTKPMRILLAGTEGVGKSTFAAGAPSPIFLAPEDGTSHLDVSRLPEPITWEDALDAVDVLTNDSHSFETLVVDTVDWLEPLCWARVCRDAGKTSIEGLGYGKGYVAALEHWRTFLSRIDALRAKRGMHTILLAHTQIRTFKSPDFEVADHDRYELKLHTKAAGVLKEWSDAVLFANFETVTKKDGLRAVGVSTGARLIHTERRAAWDAKNRYGLPEVLPLDWGEFATAVGVGAPKAREKLVAECDALLANADKETTTKAREWLASPSASDITKLAQFTDKLRAKVLTSDDNHQSTNEVSK